MYTQTYAKGRQAGRKSEDSNNMKILTVDKCDQDISLPEAPDTGGHTGFKPSFVTPSLGTFKHQCEPFCSDFISVALIKYLERTQGIKGVISVDDSRLLLISSQKSRQELQTASHITSTVESQET